jgi:hypothetical protein
MIDRLFILFLISVSTVSVSQGEISYDVFLRTSEGDAFDTTQVVNPGETIVGAELILRETATFGTLPNIGVNDVRRVGARLAPLGSDGSFENLIGNPAFNFERILNAEPDVVSLFALFLTEPHYVPADEVVTGEQYEVLIGTVDLLAPTVDQTTFLISDPDSFTDSSGDYSGGFGNNIDDSSINFHSLTLTVVPEPSSTALLAFLGIMTMRRRRR